MYTISILYSLDLDCANFCRSRFGSKLLQTLLTCSSEIKANTVFVAFQFNQTIEELDLSWNGLAEEGCRALQKSLPPNHTLKELDLTCNRINVFSLRYLLDGLEINDTLQTLFVSGPRREKTCLQGFRQSEIQTSLLSCRG